MSLGECDLKQFWSYNKLSFFNYWKSGTTYLIFSSLLLTTTFTVWFNNHNLFTFLLIFLALLSTRSFHYFTFVSQNYNALGWAVTPLFVFSVYNNEAVLATISILLTTVLSFTASVILILISIPLSLESGNYYLMLVLIPALFSLIFQISIRIGTSSLKKHFTTVLKSIGAFASVKTKYTRTKHSIINYIPRICLLLSFSFILFYHHGLIPYTTFSIILIIFTNFKLLRFIDNQSIDILILLYSTSVLFIYGINDIFLVINFFLLNYFLYFQISSDRFVKTPISQENLKRSLVEFLSQVPNHSKIFFKFNDPKDCYENCFGNERFLIDYPVYYATERYIHVFPDFSAVFDNNNQDSPSLWANTVNETVSQLNNFKTNFCIVSQEKDTRLHNDWYNNGFSLISEFCWRKYLSENNLNMDQWYYAKPKWFLLKYNSNLKPVI